MFVSLEPGLVSRLYGRGIRAACIAPEPGALGYSLNSIPSVVIEWWYSEQCRLGKGMPFPQQQDASGSHVWVAESQPTLAMSPVDKALQVEDCLSFAAAGISTLLCVRLAWWHRDWGCVLDASVPVKVVKGWRKEHANVAVTFSARLEMFYGHAVRARRPHRAEVRLRCAKYISELSSE